MHGRAEYLPRSRGGQPDRDDADGHPRHPGPRDPAPTRQMDPATDRDRRCQQMQPDEISKQYRRHPRARWRLRPHVVQLSRKNVVNSVDSHRGHALPLARPVGRTAADAPIRDPQRYPCGKFLASPFRVLRERSEATLTEAHHRPRGGVGRPMTARSSAVAGAAEFRVRGNEGPTVRNRRPCVRSIPISAPATAASVR